MIKGNQNGWLLKFGCFNEKAKTIEKVLCSMINKDQLNTYSKYCSKIITDAKDMFLKRQSVNLDDPNTSVKPSWFIINSFLNNF